MFLNIIFHSSIKTEKLQHIVAMFISFPKNLNRNDWCYELNIKLTFQWQINLYDATKEAEESIREQVSVLKFLENIINRRKSELEMINTQSQCQTHKSFKPNSF